ncbi:MAG: lactonase family protein [Treponema sp.]|jgi:6-phosphogluconolactonase|nr:lactonase family protein [Treponema sp.]
MAPRWTGTDGILPDKAGVQMSKNGKELLVYTGSFQPQYITSVVMDMDIEGRGDGIYMYHFDEQSGVFSLADNTYAIINPARLCVNQAGNRIYAASDTSSFINWEAGSGGGLYAFERSKGDRLKQADRRSSCGSRAVDICCDADGQYVVVINEGSLFCTTSFEKNQAGRYVPNVHWDEGCAVLFRTGATGFEKVCDRYVLSGGELAHPSELRIDRDAYLYIGNRGNGTLAILKLDRETEKLLPVTVVTVNGGPDGLALHPRLSLFYVSAESSGEIARYHFDKPGGSARLLQKISEDGESHPGPLVVRGDAAVLYAFDRFLGEIKVYGLSEEGRPVLFQRMKGCLRGTGPSSRFHPVITPSAKWLLASDTLGDCLYAFPLAPDGSMGEPVITEAPTPTGMLVIAE